MNIHEKINSKGLQQQEDQYLFPCINGQKALTKNEIGSWIHLEKQSQKANKTQIHFRIF